MCFSRVLIHLTMSPFVPAPCRRGGHYVFPMYDQAISLFIPWQSILYLVDLSCPACHSLIADTPFIPIFSPQLISFRRSCWTTGSVGSDDPQLPCLPTARSFFGTISRITLLHYHCNYESVFWEFPRSPPLVPMIDIDFYDGLITNSFRA